MASATEQAATLLRDRIAELERELAPLQDELDTARAGLRALEGSSTRSQPRRGGGGTSRAPRGQRREEVLGLLRADGPLKPAEIAKTLGIQGNAVSATLSKLQSEGAVERGSDGWTIK